MIIKATPGELMLIQAALAIGGKRHWTLTKVIKKLRHVAHVLEQGQQADDQPAGMPGDGSEPAQTDKHQALIDQAEAILKEMQQPNSGQGVDEPLQKPKPRKRPKSDE